MSYRDNGEWGTWNFSYNAHAKLQLLKSHLECNSPSPDICQNLNDRLWRLLIGGVISNNGTELVHNFSLPLRAEDDTPCNFLKDISTMAVRQEKELDCSYRNFAENEKKIAGKMENVTPEAAESMVYFTTEGLETTNGNDDVIEIVGDIYDLLKRGPIKGVTAKLKGKEVEHVLKAMKNNLSSEETVANLLMSVCPPVENDLLEQNRWARALYQHIVLPEILERSFPVPRLLSSAISQLASSSPDACLQYLCIPLMISSYQQEQSELSQPSVEILTKIIEESLPVQQRILLFRTFFKGLSSRGKLATQENLIPILLVLAETRGAFIGADSEFFFNLIDWLEISSQDYFSSIKFTKFFVAVLKGMAQDISCRREGNAPYFSAENKLKLKNIISQNRTFLKKIAEKSFKLIC